MNYLMAIIAGVKPEVVAIDFVYELMTASKYAGEICLQLACNFVNDTLQAIGIPGQISPEQIDDNWSYQWPIDVLQMYSFPYKEFEFAKVEMFLRAMCKEIETQNIAFMNRLNNFPYGELEDLHSECPLELLMQLIAIWHSVYKHLLECNLWGTAFEEPLARINVCLLEGIHSLRKQFRGAFPVLDSICNRLFKSALEGLRYKQANDTIFHSLLMMISQDIELFKEEAFQFFYTVLVVDHSPLIIKLYQKLQVLLEESDDNRVRIFTDILIEPKMQEIYFTTLVTRADKGIFKQQLELLKFLDVLQRKMLSVDSFPREFIEAILYLVLVNKARISYSACILYMNLMKRRMSEEIILKHFLEFYVEHSTSKSQIKDYVMHFYNNFPFFRNVYNLMQIISNCSNAKEIRFLSSQVVVIIVEIILELKECPLKKIEPILQIFPEIVESIRCQRCVGILQEILKHVAFEELQMETLDNILYYAVNTFSDVENNLEYPLLMNTFNIIHKCLIVTKDWKHLELLSHKLMMKYSEMKRKLQIRKLDQNKCLPINFWQNFDGVLKRINIIIKTDYEIFDFTCTFEQFVLVQDVQPSLEAGISFTDLYALEICLSVVIKLSKIQQNRIVSTSSCFKHAHKLSELLIKRLENTEELLKLPAFRLKVYFCGLLNLHCHFPLQLTNNIYTHMTQILIALQMLPISEKDNNTAVEEPQQVHFLHSLECYRIMIDHYTELHKYQHVVIKSNIAWKLCIHYGKAHNKFDEELKKLLITLANHRLNMYMHINAVMIYNLYKQQPPLKCRAITLQLMKYKYLIDNEVNIDLPNLLKLHIVLLVLQIVEKTLSVQQINNQHNRLKALTHLDMLLEDVDINALQSTELFLEQFVSVEKHLMTKDELQIYDNFRTYLISI